MLQTWKEWTTRWSQICATPWGICTEWTFVTHLTTIPLAWSWASKTHSLQSRGLWSCTQLCFRQMDIPHSSVVGLQSELSGYIGGIRDTPMWEHFKNPRRSVTPIHDSCPQVALHHEPWLLARPSHEWDLLQLWEKCLLWYSVTTFPWGTAEIWSGINGATLLESTVYSRTKLQCAGPDPIHIFCASTRGFNVILTDGVMSVSIQKPREHLCLDLCQ